MARPLMQQGIAQLEKMFCTAPADSRTLKRLEHELQHRQVPRAIALLEKVEAALSSTKTAASATPAPMASPRSTPVVERAPAPPSAQPELWSAMHTSGAAAEPSVRPPPLPVPALLTLPTISTQNAASSPAPVPTSLTVDEAYKVLKATPASAWESIEQMRRQIVQRAHPDTLASLNGDKCALVQAEAKRANAAYEVLRLIRVA